MADMPVKAGGILPPAPQSLCAPVRRSKSLSCCMETDTPIDRPDLAIYSQAERFAAGAQPTWNNPDITTNLVGESKLMPEAQVRVRNNSGSASAVGANVCCFVSRFGIGYERQPIGTSTQNFAPGEERELLIPFPQAVLNGDQRIGFYVRIEHATDPVLINNEGAQILDPYATSVQGRAIATSFLVRNPVAGTQSIQIQQLATEPGIQASFSVASGAFGPLEERTCQVQIDVEAWLTGTPDNFVRRDITYVARGADGNVIDGLTFMVWVDS
jgi:hypothetical protein